MKTHHELHKTNKTRIKLVCYYSHRKDGTPYAQHEMQGSKPANRKPHDIHEGCYTEGGRWITREDLSIKKALRHIELHGSKIISALMFYNDWQNEEECLIGKWLPLNGWKFSPPKFSKPDVHGNVFINQLFVLQKYKMKKEVYELKRVA